MESAFKTKDLGTGGYLMAEGMELLESKLEGQIVFFYFRDAEACRKMEQEYKFGHAKTEARKFNEAIRSLKAEVFNLKSPKGEIAQLAHGR